MFFGIFLLFFHLGTTFLSSLLPSLFYMSYPSFPVLSYSFLTPTFFLSFSLLSFPFVSKYPCGNSPAFDPKSVWRSTLILFCDSHAANEEYRILHFLVLRSLFYVWTSAFVLQVSNVPNFQSDSLPEAPYSLLLTSSHFLRLISTISIFLSNSSGDTCSIIVQG